MLGRSGAQRRPGPQPSENDGAEGSSTLLAIVGDHAKLERKLNIAGSIQIECEVSGQLRVGGKLVIGQKGVVRADVETVDAMIQGQYEGNMVATGNVEVTGPLASTLSSGSGASGTRARRPSHSS